MRNGINAVRIVAGAAALLLSGCATIIDGASQTIAMDVTPQNAQCTAWQDGKMVGIYYPTFQTMTVRKGKHDLTVLCSTYGYEDALLHLHPHGNEAWNGPVLDAVDFATGKHRDYDGAVVIVIDETPDKSAEHQRP